MNELEKGAVAPPAVSGSASMEKRWLRRLVHVLAVLLTLVVIAGLVRALRRDGPAALSAWRSADVKWGWITVAFTLGMAGHIVFVVGWRRLLADGGIPATLWQTARFFLVSNLGRYLPAAKAWQMSIVAVLAAEHRLPAAAVAATSLFQGMVGAYVGVILLLATGNAVLGISPIWLVFSLAGVVPLLSLPFIVKSLPPVRRILVRLLPSIDSVTIGTMWTLLWTITANWFLWGSALYALALGLLPAAGASIVAYFAAWIGPFLAGIIALVAPAGIGVRDEMMRTMLTSAGLSSGGALVLVVVARVWTTILDVVPAVVVLALRRGQKAPASVDA